MLEQLEIMESIYNIQKLKSQGKLVWCNTLTLLEMPHISIKSNIGKYYLPFLAQKQVKQFVQGHRDPETRQTKDIENANTNNQTKLYLFNMWNNIAILKIPKLIFWSQTEFSFCQWGKNLIFLKVFPLPYDTNWIFLTGRVCPSWAE